MRLADNIQGPTAAEYVRRATAAELSQGATAAEYIQGAAEAKHCSASQKHGSAQSPLSGIDEWSRWRQLQSEL